MSTTRAFLYDVFLSHNSKDNRRVRRLAHRLKHVGLRVWFDEWVIGLGDDIYMAVERGLETSRVQLLCLSPAALGSDWVTLERATVLFRDPKNIGRRFIPLLLTDCELPDALRRYKYVDFRRETKAAFDVLVAACRSETEAAPSASVDEPVRKPSRKTTKKLPTKPTEKMSQPKKPPEQAGPLTVPEANPTELIRLARGSEDGRPTWYYVRVERSKFATYQEKMKLGETINVYEYGEVLYSGWGDDPPPEIKERILAQFAK